MFNLKLLQCTLLAVVMSYSCELVAMKKTEKEVFVKQGEKLKEPTQQEIDDFFKALRSLSPAPYTWLGCELDSFKKMLEKTPLLARAMKASMISRGSGFPMLNPLAYFIDSLYDVEFFYRTHVSPEERSCVIELMRLLLADKNTDVNIYNGYPLSELGLLVALPQQEIVERFCEMLLERPEIDISIEQNNKTFFDDWKKGVVKSNTYYKSKYQKDPLRIFLMMDKSNKKSWTFILPEMLKADNEKLCEDVFIKLKEETWFKESEYYPICSFFGDIMPNKSIKPEVAEAFLLLDHTLVPEGASDMAVIISKSIKNNKKLKGFDVKPVLEKTGETSKKFSGVVITGPNKKVLELLQRDLKQLFDLALVYNFVKKNNLKKLGKSMLNYLEIMANVKLLPVELMGKISKLEKMEESEKLFKE